MSELSLIRNYAKYFWSMMNREGVAVEFEEVVGEFSVVYVKCLKKYNGNSESGARFSTYLFRAFANCALKMKDKWIRDIANVVRSVDIDSVEFTIRQPEDAAPFAHDAATKSILRDMVDASGAVPVVAAKRGISKSTVYRRIKKAKDDIQGA